MEIYIHQKQLTQKKNLHNKREQKNSKNNINKNKYNTNLKKNNNTINNNNQIKNYKNSSNKMFSSLLNSQNSAEPNTLSSRYNSKLNSDSVSPKTQRSMLAKSFLENSINDTPELKNSQNLYQKLEELRQQKENLSIRNKELYERLYDIREMNEKRRIQKDKLLSVLHDPNAFCKFYDFCLKKCDSENLDFWKQVTQFRKMPSSEERLTAARKIANRYLEENAHHRLNLPQNEREEAISLMKAAKCNGYVPKTLFDKIQNSVLQMIRQDSFFSYQCKYVN
eukprot:gb/GECH01014254.1/.p1 GENE.gb/GECH01014254.1/~~gb/GECH01014254.1/.p1  ORF type:complete len:280 (+),score=76.41 gb/GECH01014254.1/:1-840(+)